MTFRLSMTTTNTTKIYPNSTDEVAKILGFNQESFEIHNSNNNHIANEEIVHSDSEKSIKTEGRIVEYQASEAHNENSHFLENTEGETGGKSKSIVSTLLPYLVVFLLGLIGYYFFLSNSSFNFNSLKTIKQKEITAPITVKDSEILALQKNSATMDDFRTWISQYYFDVSDGSVIDPNADNSGNGLSNFHKFLLGLNPKSYDSIGLGLSDSEAVSQGINPLTGNKLTKDQQTIVDKYFDLEVINNRLAIEQLNKGNVAGKSITNQAYSSFGNRNIEPEGNNPIQVESARNGVKSVNRTVSTVLPVGNLRSTAFENPVGSVINSEDLNLEIPGRLEIPELNVNVPVIWTKTVKNFEKDLQLGVVHYPGTAVPGQIGTTYISGHSSNYAWAKGTYNKVFAKLGDLPNNTSFRITAVDKNGKDIKFHYVVTSRKEFSPTDQEQFRNTGDSMVALSTCWPIGSTKSRMVVFGKLTQVEK